MKGIEKFFISIQLELYQFCWPYKSGKIHMLLKNQRITAHRHSFGKLKWAEAKICNEQIKWIANGSTKDQTKSEIWFSLMMKWSGFARIWKSRQMFCFCYVFFAFSRITVSFSQLMVAEPMVNICMGRFLFGCSCFMWSKTKRQK